MLKIASRYIKDGKVAVTIQDEAQMNRLTANLDPLEVESLSDEALVDKVIEAKINEWRPNLFLEQLDEKIGSIVQEQAEIRKEQEVLAQYIAGALTPEQQEEIAVDWVEDAAYPRFSYVRYDGQIWKLLHPKLASDTTPPSIDNPVYELMGGNDEQSGLQELTPSSENTYSKGAIGVYEGRVYISNYDDNGNIPQVGSAEPDWWTDLGPVEEYLGGN